MFIKGIHQDSRKLRELFRYVKREHEILGGN